MANVPSEHHTRTILVTGATDGIGLETAKQLVSNEKENFVIIHGRSNDRCMLAASYIKKALNRDCSNMGAAVGDFCSLDDVRRLADDVVTRYPSVNVLLCNAGVLSPQRVLTKDGFELTFQVNHLAHFVLVNRLLDTLKANAPSRVVCVSSICHSWFPIKWDDLQAEKHYEKYEQYSRSKLMNHLFAFKLHRLLAESGACVTSNVLEPGVIETKLLKAGGFSGSPIQQGAISPVKCVQSRLLDNVSGKYVDNSGKIISACKEANCVKDQDTLWSISQDICKKLGLL